MTMNTTWRPSTFASARSPGPFVLLPAERIRKPVTDDEVRRLHHAHLDFVEVASADVGQAKGAVDVERLRPTSR